MKFLNQQNILVKSKIGTIFINEIILEEKSVRIYEIDPYLYEHYKKKQNKLTTMIKNTYCLELIFILLNIFQQQKLMQKVILTETLFLKKKDKRNQKKKLNCEFIKINTSKENYDADYETSRMQTFISKFKDKEKENEIKKNQKMK